MINLSSGAFSMRSIAGPGQHAVHGTGDHPLGARLLQRLRRLLNRPGGVDDVVGDHAGASADLTDHVHHFGRAIVRTALVDDGQLGIESLGVGAGALGAAGVGSDNRQGWIRLAREIVDDDRRGEQVIDGNIEEALNLRLVQIHRQHAVGAGGAHDVGDELGGNRNARLVLPVLAAIAVVRHDRRDARRRRPAERVDHDREARSDADRPGRTSAGRRRRPCRGCSRRSGTRLRCPENGEAWPGRAPRRGTLRFRSPVEGERCPRTA